MNNPGIRTWVDDLRAQRLFGGRLAHPSGKSPVVIRGEGPLIDPMAHAHTGACNRLIVTGDSADHPHHWNPNLKRRISVG